MRTQHRNIVLPQHPPEIVGNAVQYGATDRSAVTFPINNYDHSSISALTGCEFRRYFHSVRQRIV
ncbi:Uncharacterised protein [Mycobacteroides abscessus subsp. massiliense]|nr:Uncharacterised protein [Mycobacteroides abscessus subsp. massiliense]SKU12860.1 Uncharacterised protein [Mycobacteroides abscessus subsp. massiliense]